MLKPRLGLYNKPFEKVHSQNPFVPLTSTLPTENLVSYTKGGYNPEILNDTPH